MPEVLLKTNFNVSSKKILNTGQKYIKCFKVQLLALSVSLECNTTTSPSLGMEDGH